MLLKNGNFIIDSTIDKVFLSNVFNPHCFQNTIYLIKQTTRHTQSHTKQKKKRDESNKKHKKT